MFFRGQKDQIHNVYFDDDYYSVVLDKHNVVASSNDVVEIYSTVNPNVVLVVVAGNAGFVLLF